MSEEEMLERIISDAASNVACESGNLTSDDFKKIKDQLMGYSKQSDDSFIYGLVKAINNVGKNGTKTK